MGPMTRAKFPLIHPDGKKMIMDAAHVHVELDMWKRICDIASSLPLESPLEGRLPAPTTVVEIPGVSAFLLQDCGDEVRFFLIGARGDYVPEGHLASYEKRSLVVNWTKKVGAPPGPESLSDLHRYVFTSILVCDLLFMFMSEPRFVETRPISRTRRHMAAKKMGVPALRNTWVKVGWTIGRPTRAKGDPNATAPQKAYHLRRAHWRNYGDRQTEKAERRPHRPGWWVWVEATHAGHPALGEIKHHYSPKLDDPGHSSKVVHPILAAKIASSLNGLDHLPVN